MTHPFPSTLDAVLTGVVAGLAGGRLDVVVRLALAMLVIQAAIGATNDIVDTPADRAVKPGKPIAAGLVSELAARRIAAAGLVTGLLLAASVSIAALGLALAGSAVGIAYDLRLKGTAASWLPFAVGIPLLPLFGWIGAAGTLPVPILVLGALAVPAGAAIAVANSLPDLERDAAAGVASAATALGKARAARVIAILQGVVAVAAIGSFALLQDGGRVGVPAGAVGLVTSCAVLVAGVALSGRPDVTSRQHGWEVQAIATGGLAASWLWGLVAAGRF